MSVTISGPSPASTIRQSCTAMTAAGTPCRKGATANGLCALHDPTRKPPPRYREDAGRICRACGHELPARKFGFSGAKSPQGVKYRRGTCLDCEAKARGSKPRPPRYDARGHVWCFHCRQYLPALRFARHPYHEDKYWSYCRECTRWIDRHRARSIRGTEEHAEATDDRLRRKQKQNRKEQRERRNFVADAITLLGRRGLTRAEICRLCDVSFTSLIAWTKQTRKVTRNVEHRFGEILRLTHGFPLAAEPVHRRRLPHPEMPRLLSAMAPALERYPVRSSWVNGQRGKPA